MPIPQAVEIIRLSQVASYLSNLKGNSMFMCLFRKLN